MGIPHWRTLEFLAKQRRAEYEREAQQYALAESFGRGSTQGPGLIARLLAAWSRRAAPARATEPVLSEQAPRSW